MESNIGNMIPAQIEARYNIENASLAIYTQTVT